MQLFRLDNPPRLVLDLASPGATEPRRWWRVRPLGRMRGRRRRGREPSTAEPARSAEPPESGREGLDTRVELPPRALAMLENGFPDGATSRGRADPGAPPLGEPDGRPPLDEEGERPIRRIVVDAGHGGHDPGAIGPSRLREKHVTLAIARRLAAKLRAAGFEVVLTRNDDRYLALEERTALANTARGDLFVSVHANAHPRRARSGVETYFLNVTDDRYAARLAARENGVDLSAAGDLARILTDLDAKASAGASRAARPAGAARGLRRRAGPGRETSATWA